MHIYVSARDVDAGVTFLIQRLFPKRHFQSAAAAMGRLLETKNRQRGLPISGSRT